MAELRELAYQQRVLKLLDGYLEELVAKREEAGRIDQLRKERSDLTLPPFDFAEETWKALKEAGQLPRPAIPYSPKTDGVGRPVPNIVYKVPTAGGKTFLAVASLSKIFRRYLDKSTGLVLWVVPNEAIYAQTKRYLNDRGHPYRKRLDSLSGHAVKVMEKTTPLHAADVENSLCVMLLMLQSFNHDNKESRKIFQDRGDVHGFAPEEGNQLAHRRAKEDVPNLDVCDLADAQYPWMSIRDSLGNALKTIRPVVVLDEGHKYVTDRAFKNLYNFNPCFVLELTATPKDVAERRGRDPRPARPQNLLVDVTGLELDREGMIKMPLNLDSKQVDDWKTTLQAGLDRLNALDEQAKRFHHNTNRYIRPIMLVQVERTGNDQKDGQHIHAEDAKDWLMHVGLLDEAEIAVKTSDRNDLKSPENQDLLSPANRVRVIITKQALQEGWDCPFAYVLCSLSASSNMAATTQIVGRILRQPGAQKTGVGVLDECYVVTHHAETNRVVQAVKDGLEKDGMGDLVRSISVGAGSSPVPVREIERSSRFAQTKIFLPKVLRVAGGELRELDYEDDILYALDWKGLDVGELVSKIPDNFDVAERQLRRIWLEEQEGGAELSAAYVGSPIEERVFDFPHATRFISDIVPNPWLAREIVGKVAAGLEQRGFDADKLGRFSGLIYEQLRQWLQARRDDMAEERFRREVHNRNIQFWLRTDGDIGRVNWEMPFKTHSGQPEGARQLVSNKGLQLQRSLFLPMFEQDLNEDERKVALYMEDRETIDWWHRNVSRKHYGLQGWRRDKIYPDFICAVRDDENGDSKLVVLEMKGEQLEGNADTEYKEAMLQLLTDSFPADAAQCVGELELLGQDGTSVHCELVLFSEWKEKLPGILQ